MLFSHRHSPKQNLTARNIFTNRLLPSITKGFTMKIFLTYNPHIENLSQTTLLNHFKEILKKYYRKYLGARYYKHKDKQYLIGIFQEIGSTDYKQPHLHIIVDVPTDKMMKFYLFLKNGLTSIYPHLTSNFQMIGSRKYDEVNVYNYCLKEGGQIITNTDLYQKITNIN